MNKPKVQTLATREYEYRTDAVTRIGDDYFYEDRNGGSRGAWQGPTTVESINRTEARRRLLEMGVDPTEVATLTE